MPLDPFGDRPFVYHAEAGEFQLYGIGPNRQDDGRQPLEGRFGDVFLDGDAEEEEAESATG